MSMSLRIEKAAYVKDYQIKLFFSDGKENIVDFESFLRRAKNPMTSKYCDLKRFRKFNITYGDLEWNDYELCFPIWDLHEKRKIE